MKIGYIAILHRKSGYLLNPDLCCVTRECLPFLSLKLTGERLGNRLKHFLKCILDTSVLGTFVLTLPLYVPCMLSSVGSLYGLLYSYFEKGCRKKCTRQSRKVLWVVLGSLFFKEICKNGTRDHRLTFVIAKGKQQK